MDVYSTGSDWKTLYAVDVCIDFALVLFFFQAEDGIRDSSVTGVQTCALPIYQVARCGTQKGLERGGVTAHRLRECGCLEPDRRPRLPEQIGRASCRERV